MIREVLRMGQYSAHAQHVLLLPVRTLVYMRLENHTLHKAIVRWCPKSVQTSLVSISFLGVHTLLPVLLNIPL